MKSRRRDEPSDRGAATIITLFWGLTMAFVTLFVAVQYSRVLHAQWQVRHVADVAAAAAAGNSREYVTTAGVEVVVDQVEADLDADRALASMSTTIATYGRREARGGDGESSCEIERTGADGRKVCRGYRLEVDRDLRVGMLPGFATITVSATAYAAPRGTITD